MVCHRLAALSGQPKTQSPITWGVEVNQFDAICEQFQSAWSNGRSPAISEFLQRAGYPDEDSVHRLLVELVKIDLYHR